MIYVSLGAALLFAAAFAAVLALLLRERSRTASDGAEKVRLEAELELLRQTEAVKEEGLRRRLEDKDAETVRALEEKDASCRRLLDAKEEACTRILAAKDVALREKDEQCAKALREKNAEIERFLQEKERAFAETVKVLKEQFANLAAQTLKVQSADLTDLNRTQLESALKPLREQVVRLQDLTQKAQNQNLNLGESMTKDVAAIGRIAQDLSKTAAALSVNTSVQGRKGEEILAEKLRQAGLEKDVNFFLQSGTDSDRPDAQVRDTENRWLIIDSKVSLTAYLEYAGAQDEATRAAKLAAHVTSVRQKIEQLAKKKYPKVFAQEHPDRNYLPVTAMFVPYEASLLEALRAEPSLWQFALENNVVLVTPLTMLAYLRLVFLAWQHEKEARNQQAIVDTARELLTRMNSFLLTFEKLGRTIGTLQEAYDDAKGVIVDAPRAQTITKAAQKLIDLHVKLESRKGKKLERAESLKVLDESGEDAAEKAGEEGGDA